jgi:hypothetical protein
VTKAGIVLVDPDTKAVKRVIAFQINPDTLTRTLQAQGVGSDSGPHVDQLRLKGPPIETFKFEAQFDSNNGLTNPDGIAPELSALEGIVYPTTAQLADADRDTRRGTLEIIPMEAPLALFVWNKSRVVPVRITEFSVTEEMFDSGLNPTAAKVSMTLRVLSVDDVTYSSNAGSIYLAYQHQKERLAQSAAGGTLAALGIPGIP